MKISKTASFLLTTLLTGSVLCFSAEPAELNPLLAVPDKLVLQSDFSKAQPLDKAQWQARQGSQWGLEGGMLVGKPSSAQYQASKTSHTGKEPRLAVLSTPQNFIIKLSVRFSGGTETAVSPFVEFSHHVCRLHFSAKITELLAAHDSLRVNEAKGFQFKPETWYSLLAERKGDEIVVQIANGPTLYAKHPSIAEAAASGADGLGVCGANDGKVEIKNVTIYSIKPDSTQPAWETTKKSLPAYEPVSLEKKKDKKGKPSAS